MAKKSRRQRKLLKEKQIRKLIRSGVKQSEVTHLSNKEIEKKYSSIVTEERKENQRKAKARKKYQKSLELQSWKVFELEKLGFPPDSLKSSYLRKVKVKDIKSGNITRENYPFLYPSNYFDFDRIYHFPNNRGLYIAWLDYSGEHTIEELMNQFQRFSNETLITFLEGILNTPKQYNPKKKNSGSSGRAGTFRSMVTTEKVAEKMLESDNKKLEKSFQNENKKRYHTGINRYYQNITENGHPTIKSISGRELLIILNAIFYNVTEDTRDMYRGVYKNITNAIPDFKAILPNP